MKKNIFSRVGSEVQYDLRKVGEILHDQFENGNQPQAVAYREQATEDRGWHPHTELGCDLKTLLRSDKRMEIGKSYPGVLRCDSDAIIDEFLCRDSHFTFVETLPPTTGKRNPHVFDGQYLTVTRRDDGSLKLNFKELKVGPGFSLDRFALGVYNELCLALGGLIEEA